MRYRPTVTPAKAGAQSPVRFRCGKKQEAKFSNGEANATVAGDGFRMEVEIPVGNFLVADWTTPAWRPGACFYSEGFGLQSLDLSTWNPRNGTGDWAPAFTGVTFGLCVLNSHWRSRGHARLPEDPDWGLGPGLRRGDGGGNGALLSFIRRPSIRAQSRYPTARVSSVLDSS
jgi:hypothetical protein